MALARKADEVGSTLRGSSSIDAALGREPRERVTVTKANKLKALFDTVDNHATAVELLVAWKTSFVAKEVFGSRPGRLGSDRLGSARSRAEFSGWNFFVRRHRE